MDESASDRLWREYNRVFAEFDDLTLARWLAQTLGQLQGRVWRFSHPLIGAFRLGAEVGHSRQIWLKRMASPPSTFFEAPCCRAPIVPLLTRDVLETGLICQHCSETAVAFDELPVELQESIKEWTGEYTPVHAVAHWDDRQRKSVPNYDKEYELAAQKAEALLAFAANKLAPQFLDHYPVIIWEDQDECLEVAPEDIAL
jgi:hypothetical protein